MSFEAFLKTLKENPRDDTTRLIAADWLKGLEAPTAREKFFLDSLDLCEAQEEKRQTLITKLRGDAALIFPVRKSPLNPNIAAINDAGELVLSVTSGDSATTAEKMEWLKKILDGTLLWGGRVNVEMGVMNTASLKRCLEALGNLGAQNLGIYLPNPSYG